MDRVPESTRTRDKPSKPFSGGLRKQVKLPSAPPGSKPRARAEEPEGEEAATHPGAPARRSTPPLGDSFGQRMQFRGSSRGQSLDDDPVTVLADRRAIARALEEADADPATVQRPRMPMAFMDESVKDPVTVFDQGESARWRDEIEAYDDHVDEIPPGPLPPGPMPSAFQDRSGPTLARELPQAPSRGSLARHREEPAESRVTVLLPLLVGAGGGMLILALVMAWLAGSP